MDWKKIAPWNWFRHEAPASSSVAAGGDAQDPWLTLRREMDRLIDDAFQAGGARFSSFDRLGERVRDLEQGSHLLIRPSVDISEGRKAYKIRVELPGVEREDVSIEIGDDRTLVIHAEKHLDREEEDEGLHWVESAFGSARRVLSLPEDADEDNVSARFKNGVLKLEIPKHAARAAKGRSIEVQRG